MNKAKRKTTAKGPNGMPITVTLSETEIQFREHRSHGVATLTMQQATDAAYRQMSVNATNGHREMFGDIADDTQQLSNRLMRHQIFLNSVQDEILNGMPAGSAARLLERINNLKLS